MPCTGCKNKNISTYPKTAGVVQEQKVYTKPLKIKGDETLYIPVINPPQ